jgi:tellurite resistance protein
MSENIVLVQALAELAYSIALADGELEKKEKEAFNNIIETEMGKSAWSAKNRFAILDERITPNIEHSYKFAMSATKSNKKDFTDELKQKFINVIEQIADSVDGLRQQEKDLIARFKKDVMLI